MMTRMERPVAPTNWKNRFSHLARPGPNTADSMLEKFDSEQSTWAPDYSNPSSETCG